jgi:hypothetical protein
MPWVKTLLSGGKIAYTAPPECAPMTRIVFDPKAKKDQQWAIEYAYLNTPGSTLVDIENLMGL